MQQTRATWFIINSLLGILFIIWGAITNNHPLIPGDVWLVLPGIILFASGLFGIWDELLVDLQVNKFLLSNNAEGKTLAEIAEITNLDEKHVLELIMKLRAKGKLAKYFDPLTGLFVSNQPQYEYYCIFCGQPGLGGNFCSVCGKENSLSINKEE